MKQSKSQPRIAVHPCFLTLSCITREAAHNPLTFEEKKTLIAQIHKLPSQKMEQVLEIVQAAYKSDDQENGNEEIEVPLVSALSHHSLPESR